MEILEKLTTLLGRKPELTQTTFKGKQGYFPIYFNYTLRNEVSTLFAETKEQAYKNLFDYLQKNGDADGINTEHQRADSKEDKGP